MTHRHLVKRGLCVVVRDHPSIPQPLSPTQAGGKGSQGYENGDDSVPKRWHETQLTPIVVRLEFRRAVSVSVRSIVDSVLSQKCAKIRVLFAFLCPFDSI